MRETIIKLLTDRLKSSDIKLTDQSAQHAGHNEAARGGGTHFELKIVSNEFTGKSRLERHRLIYQILTIPLQKQVHALTIVALTPEEDSPYL